MDHAFWHNKWEKQEIGFHLDAVNPLLEAHFDALALAPDARVFLPLCGKTRDIPWLLAAGCRVVGVELSEQAITALFDDLGVTPAISQQGAHRHYAADGLDIFVGDFFALSADQLGAVDAVYDRAALVALPPLMRADYAKQLMALTKGAHQLLITYAYDQQAQKGPPFSVPDDEVQAHYGTTYQLTRLAQIAVPGGLRGQCPATEQVWLARRAG